jgi:hypothetical protein
MDVNLITKKLSMQDFESIDNFFNEKKTFSKQPYYGEVKENLLSKIKLCLEYPENNSIIGTFNKNKLSAIVSQTFSKNHPIWFLNYYASQNSISIRNGLGPDLESCFAFAVQEPEKNGYYDFYVSVPDLYAKTLSHLLPKSSTWSRYEYFTDVIVPENEFPKFQIHKFVYGTIVKKYPVYIRHAVLKQEYRGFSLTP